VLVLCTRGLHWRGSDVASTSTTAAIKGLLTNQTRLIYQLTNQTRLIYQLTNQMRLIYQLTNQTRLICQLTNQTRLIYQLTNQMRTKPEREIAIVQVKI
jgi:hypothetical protein